MPTTLSLEQIIDLSTKSFQQLLAHCETVAPEHFFLKADRQWSIAQHVQHLTISTKRTTAAYALPKFLVRLIGGKPRGASHSVEELTQRYRAKLQAGGVAAGPYVPGPIPPGVGRERVIDRCNRAANEYLGALKKNWKNEQLDAFVAPHPLLGKITLRELCYFTIYHTGHHLRIIQDRSRL